jgi:translation initiation factor 2 alpha subunit (eIF-2alpha)
MSTTNVTKKETEKNNNQVENKKTVENIQTESVSQILKNNTHEITKKLESQLPLKMQQFSELYTAYLHSMNNTFDSCITCEKELFEQLGVDKRIVKTFGEYIKIQTDYMLQQMDYYAQFKKYSTDVQLSAVKSWDDLMASMMKYNLKIFDQFK